MRPNKSLPVGLLALALSVSPATGRLSTEKIVIDTQKGPKIFKVEIAADDAARATGLMHRTHLAHGAGMLFDFHKPVMTAFWMKDTPLSLDIIFVRPDGTISMVAANAPPNSTSEIVSPEPVRAVIEINGGAAHDFGIGPGDKVHAATFSDATGRR
jgi:hypothetical protein